MHKKRTEKLISAVFILVLLAAGLFIFFKPTITSGFRYMQSDSGDTIFNNLLLEHSFKAIFDKQYLGTIWSPLFFYPLQNAITYCDNLWGSAPIYWLTRILFSPETSFQLWMLVISALNFISFYLLARSLKINIWFAGFASFLFAFCIPRSIQIGHQQLLPQFYSIFALLFLIKFFDKKKFKYFIFFEIFIYLQLLAGIYLGWFFVLATAIFILVFALYRKDKSIFKLLFNYKVIGALFGLLVCLVATFIPYYKTQEKAGRQSYSNIKVMLPQINSYLSVVPSALFYKIYPKQIQTANEKLPMRNEHFLFIGLSIYLLLLTSIVALIVIRKKPIVKDKWPPIFLISIIVFIIITLVSLFISSINYSFWRNIYNFVPGSGAIRAVTRIWTVSYLFLLLAIFVLASDVYRKTSSKILKIVLLVLALLSCLEQINLKPYYFTKDTEQKIQRQINSAILKAEAYNKVDAFYIRWAPGERDFYDYQIKAIGASIDLNIPTINGYGGREPRGYQIIRYAMTNGQIIDWINSNSESRESKNILILDSVILDNNFFVDHAEVVNTESF